MKSFSSTISHHPFLLHLVTLLAWSFSDSCCKVLLFFSRYYSLRLKMFSLFFVFACFLCVICVKSIINLLQYSTMQPIVLVGYPGQLCWIYKQIGLMDGLSEWNSFVSREFTVFQEVKSVGLVTNYMINILDNPQQTMVVFSVTEYPSCGAQGLGKGLQFLSFFSFSFVFLLVAMLSFKYLWAILVKVSLP